MANEKNFRPMTFDDYTGQEKAKKILKIAIKAAQLKGDCLDHMLLSAGSGIGKTTFARIIANESKQEMAMYSAPSIKKVEDMIDILQQVREHQIICIDEIHSLSRKVQETLFLCMENFTLNANIDGEVICQELPHFTVIGMTTSLAGLELPMRNRFQLHINLVPYTQDNMTAIVKNVYKAMKVDIDDASASLIAQCSRNVPRNANSYCRRVYDVALVTNEGKITEEVVRDTLDLMDINEYGLNHLDMQYLLFLADARKSVGVDAIALGLGTDKKSVETVIEPFIMAQGFATKTPRGRKITQKGISMVQDSSWA
jgi:holliday junction DNA helicase RuvB